MTSRGVTHGRILPDGARGARDLAGAGGACTERCREPRAARMSSAVTRTTHRSGSRRRPRPQRVNQPGREEGVVRAGAHPVEHERPEDWGWHGETGKAGRIGAWIAVAGRADYLVGNHEGRSRTSGSSASPSLIGSCCGTSAAPERLARR